MFMIQLPNRTKKQALNILESVEIFISDENGLTRPTLCSIIKSREKCWKHQKDSQNWNKWRNSSNKNNSNMSKQQFPNGFESWQETHFEVVKEICERVSTDYYGSTIDEVVSEYGHGGMYDLARDLTDEFESLNSGREWGDEFFEEIEAFLNEKLK